MKQQVKCQHCGKSFPLEEGLKHEAEEVRKKFKEEAAEEIKKTKKTALEEAKKEAAEEIKKTKKAAEEKEKKIKFDAEEKAKKERKAHELALWKQKKTFEVDIKRMRNKAEEASRIANQTAVETKGEAEEEILEEFLAKEFPNDKFEAVKKGKKGGDVIQFVQFRDKSVGKILHERKEVLKFDEEWVIKLINDMAKANAIIGIIFTKSMPTKSNGVVQEREGGRIIICSEDYAVLRQIVSMSRRIITSESLKESNKDAKFTQYRSLITYLSSNEFKLQYRKAYKNLKKEFEQIEKDERSYSKQIRDRKVNYDDKKNIINTILPTILTKANLPDYLLDEDNDDLLLE